MDAYRIEVDNIIGASGQFFLDQNASDLSYSNRIIRDENGEVVKLWPIMKTSGIENFRF